MRKALCGLAAILMLGAGSCSKPRKTVVAVIPKATTQVFWKYVHAGAVKAGLEDGVEVSWQGPQKEDDREMQIHLVQNSVSRGVSAIVLAPLDETAMVRPVQTALKRGIPVVIIDSDLKEKIYASYVATDNEEAGRQAARFLAGRIRGRGNVLLMPYILGHASTGARERGFLAGLKEFAPQATCVSFNQRTGVTAESALQTGQNILNKYPDLDGIFCPNEMNTLGMLRALETAGRAGKIRFVGFDVNDTLLEGLNAGKIDGLVLQNPFRMGYLGVKTAVRVLRGESVEPLIDTGLSIATRENIDTPEIQDLISADFKKWLND